ncbi:hypothetical protein G7046_g5507 [Stylonectria norvegica]|nr:hypothetical protein G7046_g5507 [Stylonectria norvegica]
MVSITEELEDWKHLNFPPDPEDEKEANNEDGGDVAVENTTLMITDTQQPSPDHSNISDPLLSWCRLPPSRRSSNLPIEQDSNSDDCALALPPGSGSGSALLPCSFRRLVV